MKYNVYVQDNLVMEIEADDTDDALRLVSSKISSQEIVYDTSKPISIKLQPKTE